MSTHTQNPPADRIIAVRHLREFQHGSDPGSHFVLIQFKNRDGNESSVVAPVGALATGPTDVFQMMANKGFDPADVAKPSDFIRNLLMPGAKTEGFLTPVPGFHGSDAYMFGRTFWGGRESKMPIVLQPHSGLKLAPFELRGDLTGWQKAVARFGRASSRLRFAIGAALAGPTLALLDEPPFGFVCFGPSSKGKTTILFAAASTNGSIGNGGLASLGSSMTGIREMIPGHRDGFLALDEVGEIGGSEKQVREFLKQLSFQAGNPKGRERANNYERTAGVLKVESRLVIGMTSEVSLKHLARHAMSSRLRGEEVRLFELPAISEGAHDIFDEPDAEKLVGTTLDERGRAADGIKIAAKTHQGVAYEAFIMKLLADDDAVQKLKAYRSTFIASTSLGARDTSYGRILSSFATVYAAAALAIDYEVLPWKAKATKRAYQQCFADAIAHLDDGATTSSATIPDSDRDKARGSELLQHLAKCDLPCFLNPSSLSNKRRKRFMEADGLRTRIKGKKPTVALIKPEVVKTFEPNVKRRAAMLKELIARGMLLPGRNAQVSTRQVTVDGHRMPFYVMTKHALEGQLPT